MALYKLPRISGIIFVIGVFWQAFGAPVGIHKDGSLDKETVSNCYFEGEFDKVQEALEYYRKNNPELSKEDQIFIYKYLSVVYATKPEEREKAESYMYQLIKLVPTIDLIDMYISDNIEAIFNKVKERYHRLNELSQKRRESAKTDKDPPEKTKKSGTEKSSKKWIWWAAGGAAVGVAVVVFLSTSGDDNPETETRTLPPAQL